MRYDIFLSYSNRDLEWATRLHRRLRRFRIAGRPLKIFFAPAALTVGESIPRALSDALDGSQHLLIAISPAWLSSEWCRFEGETVSWRDPSAAHRVLLPLLLKDCQLPPALARLRYIDFRNQSEYESSLRELIEALRVTASKSLETMVLSRERDAILNEPILPWLGFGGPSFDFLWPEMIIDPFVRTRKHPAPRQRLSDWVKRYGSVVASSVAVIGEPGVGKTTALRSLLLSDDGMLPEIRIFLHARDLATKVDSLIARSEEGDSAFGIMIDGLDEAGSDRIPEIAIALTRLQRANVATIIASRVDFFDRQYDILKKGLSNLVEVLELNNWQDSDILDFTTRYSERIDHPDLAMTVQGLLERVHGARNMLGNPMRLTLLLYLIATGANIDVINLGEPYSLYDTFYREWIREERSRGTGGFLPASIRSAHTEVAHWLNEYKGEVMTLAQLVGEAGRKDVDGLLSDTAFQGLLTLGEDDSDNLTIISFRHETIGEFLIARNILESFGEAAHQLQRALRVTMTHDVNMFVRSGLHIASRSTVERYFSNLSARYQELLPASTVSQSMQDSLSAEQAERLRQQILYYIGRMPLDIFPDILRQAFRAEPRALLRRAAALGAILHGDFTIEREYMSLLEDAEEALLNRSVQMVNFGDVHADLYAFEDQGQDWLRTRAAIYDRLEGGSIRDLRLRWWDIKTLRSFYESRYYRDTLLERERRIIENVALSDSSSEERSAALRREHQLLLNDLALLDGG